LIGEDNVEKTRLMEMIAGDRLCTKESTITVRDGDFFVGKGKPDLDYFIAYRSSNVILDPYQTAEEHMNVFAHLRGKQKHLTTRKLAKKLLPRKTKIELFTESQRQLL